MGYLPSSYQILMLRCVQALLAQLLRQHGRADICDRLRGPEALRGNRPGASGWTFLLLSFCNAVAAIKLGLTLLVLTGSEQTVVLVDDWRKIKNGLLSMM